MSTIERKRVKMKEVANMAGVSISAVSMALSDSPQISDSTKKRVRQVCEELGYRQNRSRRNLPELAQADYGFVVFGESLQDDALSGLIQGLTSHSAQNNVRLEITSMPEISDERACVEHLRTHSQDRNGLILTGLLPRAVREELANSPIPHVVLGNIMGDKSKSFDQPFIRSISCGDIEMGRMATEWLFNKGHKHVAFVCQAMPTGLYASRWADGYRLAHSDAGMEINAKRTHIIGYTPDSAREAAKKLLEESEHPTAFVLPDVSLTAHTFLETLREGGLSLTPQNVVIGCGMAATRRFHMEDYPLITEDSDAMTQTALQTLELLRRGDMVLQAHLVLPCLTRNLDI